MDRDLRGGGPGSFLRGAGAGSFGLRLGLSSRELQLPLSGLSLRLRSGRALALAFLVFLPASDQRLADFGEIVLS